MLSDSLAFCRKALAEIGRGSILDLLLSLTGYSGADFDILILSV